MRLIQKITNAAGSLIMEFDGRKAIFTVQGQDSWLYPEAILSLQKELNKKKKLRNYATMACLKTDLKGTKLSKSDVREFLNACLDLREKILND